MIEARGAREDLEKFKIWCHKEPELAQVEKVEITPIENQDWKTFEIE